MKYKIDSNTPFYQSGTILNCADGSSIDPANFRIESYMKTLGRDCGNRENVGVTVEDKQVTFTATLEKGIYEWVTILHHKADKNRAWQAPKVIIEVT